MKKLENHETNRIYINRRRYREKMDQNNLGQIKSGRVLCGGGRWSIVNREKLNILTRNYQDVMSAPLLGTNRRGNRSPRRRGKSKEAGVGGGAGRWQHRRPIDGGLVDILGLHTCCIFPPLQLLPHLSGRPPCLAGECGAAVQAWAP